MPQIFAWMPSMIAKNIISRLFIQMVITNGVGSRSLKSLTYVKSTLLIISVEWTYSLTPCEPVFIKYQKMYVREMRRVGLYDHITYFFLRYIQMDDIHKRIKCKQRPWSIMLLRIHIPFLYLLCVALVKFISRHGAPINYWILNLMIWDRSSRAN